MYSDSPLREEPCLWILPFVLAEGAVLVGLTFVATLSPLPIWRPVALLGAAWLPYAAAMGGLWRSRHRLAAGWPVLVLALGLRLCVVASPPIFSDDVYRYVWDGRVVGSGTNPYRHAPNDEALAGLGETDRARINHPGLRTPYPPFAELYFGAVAAVAPFPIAFQLASALLDVGVVWLVLLLAGGRAFTRAGAGCGDEEPAGKAVWAAASYGFCPLAVVETGMSGHVEPLAVGATLLGMHLATRGRLCGAAGAMGAAAATKLLPLLLVPPLARRLGWRVALVPAIAIACYAPFIGAGTGCFETLDALARRWEGNAGAFALLKSGFERAIGWVAAAPTSDAMVHVSCLDGVARALQGTFFALHKDGAMDPLRPGAFTVEDLSLASAKLVAGAGVAAVVVEATRRRFAPARAALWIFGALVLLSPVLHPWYLLWVLPCATLCGSWPWLVLAATLSLAYLPLEGWWRCGDWRTPPWVPWVEHGGFAAALLVDASRRWLRLRSRHE